MDISLLSKMVGELILDNDRVGLPGVGTFVAEEVPATFSDRGYTINPPYRRLSFVPVASDDTLLVDLYAISNKVNSKEAERIIGGFLGEMLEDLKEKGAVDFPGLGRMKMTRQNSVLFFCDKDLEIFPGGFGLEPISLKTHSETDRNQPEVTETKPVPETSSETAISTETAPETAPEALQEPVKETAPESPHKPAEDEKKKSGVLFKVLLTVLLVAVVVVAAFFALAKLSPDLLDKLLYTTEELEIINY